MNVPKLRFKEFEGEWEERELSEFLSFNNGINASKEAYGHGRKFINVLDILNNNFITYETIIGSVSVSDDIERNNKVEYGDVLFLRSSETREDVGKSSVYLDNNNFALFGGFVIRGKRIGHYNPVFLKLSLESPSVRKQIEAKSGGSTRFNVSQSILSSIRLHFPKTDEQKKIANFISNYDKRIELQQEKVEALKEQKKGLLQKIFSREQRFKDENGEKFPDWKTKKLVSFVEIGKAGGTPAATNRSYYGGDIPFLSIKDMTEQGKYIYDAKKRISEAGLKNSTAWVVPKGSLIYSMYASIGFVSINKIPLTTSQAMYAMIIKKSENVEYLYYFLNYFKEKGLRRLVETGTQGNINAETVKNINVPTPCNKEQEKIVALLRSIDNKINLEIHKLTLFQEQKKGLMQQMFV